MTDLAADFNACLQSHGAKPVAAIAYDVTRINKFLQEAYSINNGIAELTRTLRSTRARYLSSAHQSRRHAPQNDDVRPLTDRERDAFDASSKQLLRNLHGLIQSMKGVEDARYEKEEQQAIAKRAQTGLSGLSRWAAGGAITAKSPEEELQDAGRKTIAAFREAVLLFLQQRLEATSKIQTDMMETRLTREVEKAKSVLHKSKAGMSIPYARDEAANTSSSHATDRPIELSQEQEQLFAAEGNEMMKYYEDQNDQIRKAERSILEISELHTQLHANLEIQSSKIESLVQDSYTTTENLGKGNKELKKASERRSTAQAVFYSTAIFCSFLVIWDLFV